MLLLQSRRAAVHSERCVCRHVEQTAGDDRQWPIRDHRTVRGSRSTGEREDWQSRVLGHLVANQEVSWQN